MTWCEQQNQYACLDDIIGYSEEKKKVQWRKKYSAK